MDFVWWKRGPINPQCRCRSPRAIISPDPQGTDVRRRRNAESSTSLLLSGSLAAHQPGGRRPFARSLQTPTPFRLLAAPRSLSRPHPLANRDRRLLRVRSPKPCAKNQNLTKTPHLSSSSSSSSSCPPFFSRKARARSRADRHVASPPPPPSPRGAERRQPPLRRRRLFPFCVVPGRLLPLLIHFPVRPSRLPRLRHGRGSPIGGFGGGGRRVHTRSGRPALTDAAPRGARAVGPAQVRRLGGSRRGHRRRRIRQLRCDPFVPHRDPAC